MTGRSNQATGAGRPLLIFDGDCGFCTSSARAGQRWLGLDHVEPWQFLDLDHLPVTEDDCREAVQWVAVDGTVATAHEAVIAALRHAGGIWALPGRVLALPGIRRLAGVVYRTVANNRYRLPGGTPACRVPPA